MKTFFLSILLVVVGTTFMYAQNATMRLEMPATMPAIGEEFFVEVWLDVLEYPGYSYGEPSIKSGQIGIVYDPAVLTLIQQPPPPPPPNNWYWNMHQMFVDYGVFPTADYAPGDLRIVIFYGSEPGFETQYYGMPGGMKFWDLKFVYHGGIITIEFGDEDIVKKVEGQNPKTPDGTLSELRTFLTAWDNEEYVMSFINYPTADLTILDYWSIPGQASGLAWDGTYFYFGIYGANGDEVYKFDPSDGSSVLLFSSPDLEDAFGMTYDGTHLWVTDHANSSSDPAYAMQFNFAGNLLDQFDLPDHYMSGIEFDNGDFWVATYLPYPGTVYKVDNAGTILTQFQYPGDQPWDLCLENDNFWFADYNDDMIYKTDINGTLLESHASENIQPSGIAFDGQYLWYVAGAETTSKIYKVDLGGAVTPVIAVPVDYYNFGNVSIGDSSVWNCTVNNIGAVDLDITNLVIQNAVPIFVWMTFPQTIAPGGFLDIPFIFKPTETGSLNTIVTIESSDPVTIEVDVTLEGEAEFDPRDLTLKVFLEGPFLEDEMTPLLNIFDEVPLNQPYNTEPWNYEGNESVAEISSFNEIDWVLVELLVPEIASDGFEILAQRAGFITVDGSIKDLDGINNIVFYDVEETEFYVRIHHRNHLPITSSVTVSETDGFYSYDFTTDADKAIGGIRVQKELNTGIWGTMAGDGDANGQIDNKDKNDVWYQQHNAVGYLSGDFDMNRQVSDVDKNSYWEFNAGKGVPEGTLEIVIPPFTCGDPLIDTRDGQSYNTVQIGDQCWMAENLNIGAMVLGINDQINDSIIEKYCYNNIEDSCSVWGGLYQWDEMMDYSLNVSTRGICPFGWHLPSDDEWKILEGNADSYYGVGDPEWDEVGNRGTDVGGNLKDTLGWINPNTGATNLFGFSAIPSGYNTGSFVHLRYHNYLWASTEYNGFAWARAFNYNKMTSSRYINNLTDGYSVRCLKD